MMPIPMWAILLLEHVGTRLLLYAQKNWRWGERVIVLEEDTRSECRLECKKKEPT